MESLDLTKIKYYPDRFYICLDGFDLENLTTFLSDLNIGQQQAIFIHEYYHYLTNIATPPGVRQFQVNFCDRFKLTTLLTHAAGLDAFPLLTNKLEICQNDIKYWHDIFDILEEDNVDGNVVKETMQTQTGKFSISRVEKVMLDKEYIIKNELIQGGRKMVEIHTEGLLTKHSFYLTFGAIDEFLSSAIDEFLFENDLSDINPRILNDRPFYPYQFFETLLGHFGITRPTALEKILIAYAALDAQQPPVALIEILEGLQNGGYDTFKQDPEAYLHSVHRLSPQYDGILAYIRTFVMRIFEQGRIQIAQAMAVYNDIFLRARQRKEQDFLYFIRPFLVTGDDSAQLKQLFLQALAVIVNEFNPPVILKDNQLYRFGKSTEVADATLLLLATYDIYESLKTNRIATRPPWQKAKYAFPGEKTDSDNIDAFTPPPIPAEDIFRTALNQVGLYGVYLQEQARRKRSTDQQK